MLNLLILAAGVAVLASVWHYILTQRNHMAFDLRCRWGDAYAARMSKAPNSRRTKCLNWLQRSWFQCSYCMAGQLAVVVFVGMYCVRIIDGDILFTVTGEHVFTLPIFTAAAIFIETATGQWLKNLSTRR